MLFSLVSADYQGLSCVFVILGGLTLFGWGFALLLLNIRPDTPQEKAADAKIVQLFFWPGITGILFWPVSLVLYVCLGGYIVVKIYREGNKMANPQ